MLDAKWNVDADGKMEIPMLSGFSMAALEHRNVLLVQLRCAVTGPMPFQEDLRLQCGLNIEGARELAAALLKAAQLMEDAPVVGKLN